MAKHVHAELMMQYAQDAMETDKPWGLWEWYVPAIKGWVTMSSNPDWNTRTEYRRKPKMISVTLASGEVVSWPEPVHSLKIGDVYWYVGSDFGAYKDRCTGDVSDDCVAAGNAHLTYEAAQQHADALLKISTQGLTQND